MPGTVVAIGLNSPRISTGAAGFMSHMSRWLGPPLRKMRMQASADAACGLAGLSRASRSRGKDSPSMPIAPTCSTWRRDNRSGPRHRSAFMGYPETSGLPQNFRSLETSEVYRRPRQYGAEDGHLAGARLHVFLGRGVVIQFLL